MRGVSRPSRNSDLLDVQLPRWGPNLVAAMVMILVGGFILRDRPRRGNA